ncbi:MAG: serine/threonine-protein kinase [Myxococcota bacterium]
MDEFSDRPPFDFGDPTDVVDADDGPTVPGPGAPPTDPSGVEASAVLSPGTQMGKYRIRRLLGQGGMGSVYEAYRQDLELSVALKVLHPEASEIPGAADRFLNEAKAISRIDHEHVVRVFDVGVAHGRTFLVMELLEGASLDGILETRYLEVQEAVALTLDVISAVDAAHQAGVIHRDLKPANVFVVSKGGRSRAKVVDFGISKARDLNAQLTQTGEFVGTPGYAAPEQLRDAKSATAAADQYSIAVMLYEMLIGAFPFAEESPYAVIHRVLSGQVAPVPGDRAIPDPLLAVVTRAMHVEPAKRFATLKDFAQALLPYSPAGDQRRDLGSETAGLAVENAMANESPASSGKRAPWVLPVGGAVAAFIVAVVVFAVAWSNRAPEAIPVVPPLVSESALPAGPPVSLGISNVIGAERLSNDYAPLADYLTRELERPVQLIALSSHDRVGRGVIAGDVDIAWLPAYEYVRAARNEDLEILAAPVERGDRRSYQGIILAKAGASNDLTALRGKVFCYVSPTSSSGYFYPRILLERAGVNPDEDFSSTRFVGNHQAVLPAVAEGSCDAAATYAGTLYNADEADLRSEDFTIVASTGAIPYGPYVAGPHLPQDTVETIRRALLELAPGSADAQDVFGDRSLLSGFEPADDPIYDVLRANAAN